MCCKGVTGYNTIGLNNDMVMFMGQWSTWNERVHVVVVCALLAVMAGCAGKIVPQSATDTPQNHYTTGLQLLEKSDVVKAREHFERAVKLNKKSPLGYTGMAFLELVRSQYDTALDCAQKAVDRDPSFADACAVRGRILTVRKRGEHWYEEARQSLDRAYELAPDDQRVLHYLGECCLKARKYTEAAQWFEKAAVVDGAYTEDARERASLVRAIIEVDLVSERGCFVALKCTIDRSDFAVVLLDEFLLKQKLEAGRPVVYNLIYDDGDLRGQSTRPLDVDAHPARNAILEIIPYHIPDLDVFPNGYFYPDKVMTRAQAAVVFQAVLVLLKNDDNIATRYIGSPSPFVDVRGDYYAFNAIITCVNERVLFPDTASERFSPDGTLSGVEALKMIRDLERLIGE